MEYTSIKSNKVVNYIEKTAPAHRRIQQSTLKKKLHYTCWLVAV